MTDTAEILLEEAQELISCPSDMEQKSNINHDCPWCKWRRRYRRFKEERENAQAANIARMLGDGAA